MSEQVDVVLENAKRYTELLPAYYTNPSLAIKDEEFEALSLFFAIRNWNKSTIQRYVREHDPDAILRRGRELLRGEGRIVEI